MLLAKGPVKLATFLKFCKSSAPIILCLIFPILQNAIEGSFKNNDNENTKIWGKNLNVECDDTIESLTQASVFSLS